MRYLVPVSFLALALFAPECTKHEQTEVQHGGDLYGRMCAVCHGPSGEGYKADNATALANQEFLASVSDDFLRKTIVHGRTGTVMSAWGKERGGPLATSDVDALIKFLRSWQTRPGATLDQSPRTGDATRGQITFARECEKCHGPTGTQGPNVRIGDPDFLANVSDGYLRYAIKNGRPGTQMVSFTSTIGASGVEDVLALLRQWERPSQPELRAPPPPPPPPAPLPLGPVPLNPKGPEPRGFTAFPPGKVTCDTLKTALDQGAKVGILDARAPTDYAREHIAGAVSVPFYDPEPYVAELPKDAWLVCYCSCPSAESGMLCSKLVDKGFKKVTVLEEGLGVWMNKKYPTHTGAQP